MYLSYRNAKDLYNDAEILEKTTSSRAYTLYHLAIEECGRFHLLYNLFKEFVNNEITAKEFNFGTLKKRGYESHQLKIKENFDGIYRITYILLALSKNLENAEEFEEKHQVEIDELTKIYEETLKLKEELNELKNKSLYVTVVQNKFILPETMISYAAFHRIKKLATISIQAMQK